MATLILGAAGTALGGAMAGTVFTAFGTAVTGAMIGGAIGSMAGSMVDAWIIQSMMPGQKFEGQRSMRSASRPRPRER